MSQLAVSGRTVRTTHAAAARQPRPAPRPAARPTARSIATSPSLSRRVEAVAGARRGGSGFMLLVGAIALFGVMALLMLNTMRAEQSFTVSRLQSDVTTLEQRQQQLQSDLSTVSSPENLAVKAGGLGMVKASSVKFVRASDHKSLGVATSKDGGKAINVNTLPNTPASKVASQMLADGAIGSRIVDPQVKAKAEARKAAGAEKNTTKQNTTDKNATKAPAATTPTKAAVAKH